MITGDMLMKMYTLQRINNTNSRYTTYKIGKLFITLKDPDFFAIFLYYLFVFGIGFIKPM